MIDKDERAEAKQLEYYRDTAHQYDCHLQDEEHNFSLDIIAGYLQSSGAASVLDTGCGTGRGIAFLRQRFPAMRIHGNDPSPDLLRVAVEQHNVPASSLTCCGSYTLPFADGEFDVVIELGMLHHVEFPNRIVLEMLRVAKTAVFISDSNRFGQGPLAKRVVKLALFKMGVWSLATRLQHRGKKYYVSEGDGVAYSYSVYDSWPVLTRACSRLFVVPTMPSATSPWFPLVLARHVLVAGIK